MDRRLSGVRRLFALFVDKGTADAGGLAPAAVLTVAVAVGLATVAVMAVLVRRYLDLWQQALGRSRRMAGAVLLATAVLLLGVEAIPR